MFDIEKNVPAPKNGAGSASKYPFRSMEIDDSFLVPSEALGKTTRNSIVSAARYSFGGKGHVKTRAVDGGIRVWRIK